LVVAKAAAAKKAHDIIVIDMRRIPTVADYFVIASGRSTTQVGAIKDNIAKKMAETGERLWHVEGEREGLWVLLDYGDVVAHVFYEETRRFYELERLWGDAPQKHYKEPRKKRRIRHVRRKKRV
jgi:ribosome-associated protein